MVEILCKFIRAERTGNLHLHLQAVKDMLPFFASSGHSLYAKSVYIYLQTMSNLQETHPQVYAKFQEGYMLFVEVTDFGQDCQLIWLLNKSS